jgi:hypothetical protein
MTFKIYSVWRLVPDSLSALSPATNLVGGKGAPSLAGACETTLLSVQPRRRRQPDLRAVVDSSGTC